MSEDTTRRVEEVKVFSPATAYLQLYPKLVEVARACGYALAVHGSLGRDLDLIAVPWVEEAMPTVELINALCDCTGLYRMYQRREDLDPIHTNKPHGRVAFKLYPGGPFYVDISVMPRRRDEDRPYVSPEERAGLPTLAEIQAEPSEDAAPEAPHD